MEYIVFVQHHVKDVCNMVECCDTLHVVSLQMSCDTFARVCLCVTHRFKSLIIAPDSMIAIGLEIG